MPSVSPEFDGIIERGRSGTMDVDEVAELATRLAGSGRQLVWSSGAPLVDLASTGGPGSLSTLIAPLELRRLGCRVVKLGVPGRPAGGIDALGTIRGYSTTLDEGQVRRVIDAAGYAHFLADERFAPMDAALFAYRREHGAVAIAPLAAASLLSKKIAVGLQFVGLDVRVGPHGNFGATLPEARSNARLFCAAARKVGIEAVAFLFAAPGLEQPWIGRGEALVALGQVLDGQAAGALSTHALRCLQMAHEIARMAGADSRVQTDAGLREIFEMHLRAQGSSWDAYAERLENVGAAARRPIRARADGVLSIDVSAIRDALVAAQREAADRGEMVGRFADPAGLLLQRDHGETVCSGDVIAELRVATHRAADPIGHVEGAFTIDAANVRDGRVLPMEVIRA
jgi:pyrimidine-nucleoside phosphorylase